MPEPSSPAEAAGHRWTAADRALVAGLRRLRAVADADELLITTITHGHRGRVRSYALLADAWYG
ncbi:hypothetical protein [Streptomyces carpaticus]|uniref:Uncharacterized protein n=1 Tax=Streptomyces carpaticus TaxID=285558 RepID=A0ABV4ZPU6_9ACTN